MRTFFIFILLFPLFQLSTKEDFLTRDEIIQRSCATTEGILSTIIDGSVSAINGEVVESQNDLYLVGPEPLIWQRSYSTNPAVSKYRFEPIEENIPHYYPLWQNSTTTNAWCQVDDKGYSSDRYFFVIPHLSGSMLTHKKKAHHSTRKFQLQFDSQMGWTNCSTGAISGRNNPKNTRSIFDPVKISLRVLYGSGDERFYRQSPSEWNERNNIKTICNIFEKEIKANGNQILSNKKGALKSSNRTNSITFASIKEVQISKEEFHLQNSHMEPVIYRYKEKKTPKKINGKKIKFHQGLLTSVTYPHKPEENFSYESTPI
jgi:hypothetical protein